MTDKFLAAIISSVDQIPYVQQPSPSLGQAVLGRAEWPWGWGWSAQGFQEVGAGLSKLLLGIELEYSMRFSVWSVRTSLQPERGTSRDCGDRLSSESKWGQNRALQSQSQK